jgi:hypothetical protein
VKSGHLSQYFQGVVAKRLSAVEANRKRSHQHEFNGVQALKALFGIAAGSRKFPAKFLYLGEDEDNSATADGTVTWYDAREHHVTRTEHRLYFPTTPVSELAAEGDLLLIGQRPDGEVLVLIAKAKGTVENQVLWLFNLELAENNMFVGRKVSDSDDRPVDFAAELILEGLGIEPEAEENLASVAIQKFPEAFPATRVFSAFARETLKNVSAKDDPDAVLVAWMDQEEKLFRGLERHIVAARIRTGFGSDVDSFISFSLSLQNRRKSRAGFALENHLERIFQERKLPYDRGAMTEGRSTPDFLFPGKKEYHDKNFPTDRLSMLGAKSTCKERWRQVLAEANRIKKKHLLTLEPGISIAQTSEMKENHLQLVVPKSLHDTYTSPQQSWLMNLREFIVMVEKKQRPAV